MTTTTTLYRNSELNPLTLNGNTVHDQAHTIWYSKMNTMQRFEVMNKVHNYKNMAHKLRACLNFIAENIEVYGK